MDIMRERIMLTSGLRQTFNLISVQILPRKLLPFEGEREASIAKRFHLLRFGIVCDADDGDFGLLDEHVQRSHAASIAS